MNERKRKSILKYALVTVVIIYSFSFELFGVFTRKENISEHQNTKEAVKNDDQKAKQDEKNSKIEKKSPHSFAD